jgi:hypothetical protein
MTGRTANRDQDWTVSAEVTGRLFDRLAGPNGLTENDGNTRPGNAKPWNWSGRD